MRLKSPRPAPEAPSPVAQAFFPAGARSFARSFLPTLVPLSSLYCVFAPFVKSKIELLLTFVWTAEIRDVIVVFIDIYEALCADRGVAPTRVLVELGVSKSAIANWRRGGEPSSRTKKQIADYFGLSVSELMSGDIRSAQKGAPHFVRLDDEMAELLEHIRRTPDMKVLFDLSRKATPSDVRKLIKIIRTLSGEDDGTDHY